MTDLLCIFLEFLKGIIVEHFPAFSISSGNLSAISDAFNAVIIFIGQTNFFIPIPTILTITVLINAFKLTKFGLFIVNWIIRRIRGG